MRFNKLTARSHRSHLPSFLGICSIDGDDPSGAGSGGASGTSSDPVSETPNLSDGFGGQHQQEANHWFGDSPEPTEAETNQVASILRQGQDPEFRPTMADIGRILSFAPALKPKAQEQQPAPQGAAPQQQQPAPNQQQPPVQQQQQQPQQQTPQQMAQVVAEALRQAGVNAPQQAPQQPAPQQPRPFYGEGGFKPAMQVSPQLLEAIVGTNDPAVLAQAGPAVNTLVNGILNTVMSDVGPLFAAMQQQIMQQVPQVAQTQMRQQTTEQQFYGRFPELNKPAFKGTVGKIAESLLMAAQQQGIQLDPHSEVFQQKLGEATHVYLKNTLGFDIPRATQQQQQRAPIQAPPQVQQQQQPAPRAAPAAFFTPGSNAPAGRQQSDLNGHQSADLVSFMV